MLHLSVILPPPATALALAGLGLAVASAAGAGFGRLKLRRRLATGYTRKLFHFTIFSLATLLHVWGGMAAVNAFSCGVVAVILFGLWRGDGYPLFEALARESDAPHRAFFIFVPLLTTALGGLASNALAGDFALVGYLVTGWGDAVGEPVGRRFGRHPYRVPTLLGVPSTRSLEGSAAVGLAALLATLLTLLLAFHQPFSAALARAAAVAFATVAIEAASPHGSDNFTTMVGAALLVRWLA
jgi:phytol kinase